MRQSVAPARDLLDRLGAPDRRLETVLVTGTKGKGSVASLVATALVAAGERVGLYTSPHVEHVGERVRVDGAEVPPDLLAESLERALVAREAAVEAGSAAGEATWFDVLTAAALDAMVAAEAGVAVLECGLGGRLDSTRAVTPVLSVVTNVALEHTAILGPTREAIAREKAGVAEPGVPLVTGLSDPGDPAFRALAQEAERAGARLVSVELSPGAPLAADNERLAREVLHELGRPVPGAGLDLSPADWHRAARLPGRLERVGPGGRLVLDGAHVPESLARVLDDLARQPGLSSRPDVVLGCRADKDLRGLLKVLVGRVDRVHCTSLGRGLDASAEHLLGLARELGLEAEGHADPETALAMARRRTEPNRWILVTGSLHLVGHLRSFALSVSEGRPC